MRVHTDRDRAESFGAVADAYDRVRPGYPAGLVDDLVRETGAGTAGSGTALDVGCGTGQFARALAARGMSVLGLEIDRRMAAVARGHGIPVEIGAFETWDAAGRSFDLVVSGQAWHWVDPVVGPAVAASVLRPGGVLALAWNYGRVAGRLGAALDGVYAEHAPELLRSTARVGAAPTIEQIATDVAASGRFCDVTRTCYRWPQCYTADGYATLLTTHSDHRRLPPRRLTDLVGAVRGLALADGGQVVVDYRTHVILAHAGPGRRGTL